MLKSEFRGPNSEHVDPVDKILPRDPLRVTNVNAGMMRPPKDVPEIALKADPKV